MTHYKTTGKWSATEAQPTIAQVVGLSMLVVVASALVAGSLGYIAVDDKPRSTRQDCGIKDAKLSGPEVLSVNTTDPATSLKLSEKLSNPSR